jgi:hypothetical protein
LSLGTKRHPWRLLRSGVVRMTLMAVAFSLLFWVGYVFKSRPTDHSVPFSQIFSYSSLQILWRRWLIPMTSMVPHFRALLISLIVLSGLTLSSPIGRKRWPRLLIFYIILAFTFAQNILHYWVGHYWEAPYLIYFLPSFFLAWGHVIGIVKEEAAKHTRALDHSLLTLGIPLTAFVLVSLVPMRSEMNVQPGGDQWVRVRKQILEDHLNVKGMIGMGFGPLGAFYPENVTTTYLGCSWLISIKGVKALPWAEGSANERSLWKVDDWLHRNFKSLMGLWENNPPAKEAIAMIPCRDADAFEDLPPGTKWQEPAYVNLCMHPTLVKVVRRRTPAKNHRSSVQETFVVPKY